MFPSTFCENLHFQFRSFENLNQGATPTMEAQKIAAFEQVVTEKLVKLLTAYLSVTAI